MPNSKATLVYTATPGGVSGTRLAAAMIAVPYPADVLSAFGLLIFSDTPANGPPALRTTVLQFVPDADATATTTLGADTGGLALLTLTGGGSNYAALPDVHLSPPDDPVGGRQAQAKVRQLEIASVTVTTPGTYTVAPVVTAVGGTIPGGPAATLQAVIDGGGHITAINVLTGGAYQSIPKIVIDPTHQVVAGAAVALLSVEGIDLLDGGLGYRAAATVTIVPRFKVAFPDTVDQRAPFYNIGLQAALAKVLRSPVAFSTPVIS